MTKVKLTQSVVDRGALARNEIHWDGELPGFGVRVRKEGHATYVAQYRHSGQSRRMTLASTQKLTLKQARDEAKAVFAKVRLGQDPQQEKKEARRKKPAGVTVKDVADKFLEVRLTKRQRVLRDSSRRHRKYVLQVLMKPLHKHQVDELTRRDVADHLVTIARDNGPVAADRARSVLGAMYSWAIRSGIADANPTINVPKHAVAETRSRHLSMDELTQLWAALPEKQYGDILRLLILTGARAGEIGALRWDEVDLDARQVLLPGSRTKNHRDFILPLSDTAHDIIAAVPKREGSPYVFGRYSGPFSGWSKAKSDLDKVAKLKEPWRVHDLRLTFATHVNEEGLAEPHIVEACLNHISGHQGGVAGIYNKATYAKQKAAAVQAWANHLKVALARGRGENVVKLRGGKPKVHG